MQARLQSCWLLPIKPPLQCHGKPITPAQPIIDDFQTWPKAQGVAQTSYCAVMVATIHLCMSHAVKEPQRTAIVAACLLPQTRVMVLSVTSSNRTVLNCVVAAFQCSCAGFAPSRLRSRLLIEVKHVALTLGVKISGSVNALPSFICAHTCSVYHGSKVSLLYQRTPPSSHHTSMNSPIAI